MDVKSILKSFAAGLFSVAAMFSAGSASASYSQMYVFGDSTSDNGMFRQLTGYPNTPFFDHGRFSNGHVAPEYVADRLGLTLTAGVNNFAVGGAYSGYGNNVVYPTLTHTGMFDQYDAYHNAVGAVGANPNALYFLWGGSNNMNACNWMCSQSQINTAADNIATLASNLYAIGARHFFVSNLYAMNPTANIFNARLLSDINALIATGMDIEFFDAHAVMTQMYSPSNPWGFTVNNAGCYQGTVGTQYSVCANPDTYIWGYGGHLTAAANRVMGEAMADALVEPVPEPQTMALLLAACIGFVASRRKLQK